MPVFVYQAFGIRPAFFGLNRVLTREVQRREARVPELRRFAKPVRIVFGADDPYLNKGVAREFHSLFPNSELFLIEDASHYVQIDQPQKVATLIRAVPDRPPHLYTDVSIPGGG